ncbi:PH domain-containing protein [Nocardiopsis terrae]
MDRRHESEPNPHGAEPTDPATGGWVAPGSTPSGTARGQGAAEVSDPDPAPSAPAVGGAAADAPSAAEQPRSWWGEASEGGSTADSGARSARRLSPRSMVVGPINQLRSLLLPVLAGLVVGGFNPWLLTATGAGVVALLIGGLVTWRTFRYEVEDDRIEIRRGLIRRSRRTIPLERVRGVDVTSTLLHRMLGVAVVRIEAAAGSAGATEDGKLDAVSAAEAERLRRVLLHRRAVLTGRDAAARRGPRAADPAQGPEPGRDISGTEDTPGADEVADDIDDADATVTHFTMPRSWYLYGVLSLGYLLTPFVVLATLLGMVQQSAGEVATDFFVDWVTSTDRAFLLVFGTVSVGVLVALMPVFAVVSYSLTHWGFSLRDRDGSLVAERGLFTRRSVTLEKRRIRGYELLDNPLERTRGAVGLRAIVTGLGDTATRAVLLPIGSRPRVEEVVDSALALFRGSLTRHPRAALYRRLIRAVLPFAVVAAVALAFGALWPAAVAGVLALLGVPLAVDRYRSLGHGYDGERVSVRSGSLSRSQATVERSAVIGWTWTQTLFQRRSRLADLQVTVGAGAGGYTAQDASLEESVDFAARITPEMVRPFLAADGDEEGWADDLRGPGRGSA